LGILAERAFPAVGREWRESALVAGGDREIRMISGTGDRARAPKLMDEAVEVEGSSRRTHPMGSATEPVTEILEAISAGEPQAAEQLLPLVYDELRRLAAAKMAKEAPGQTIQPTALVHEAWLRLARPGESWSGREHFFRAAAEAMRRILVDRARHRAAAKRGSNPLRTELSDSKIPVVSRDEQMLAVDEALDQFAVRDPISAELVKLRYFVGLSMAEAAESLGLPLRAAERRWTFAKAWLRNAIQDGGSG